MKELYNEYFEIYKLMRERGNSHKSAIKKVRKALVYKQNFNSLEGFWDD